MENTSIIGWRGLAMVRHRMETFFCTVEAETDAALLCDFGGYEIWIPKSQIGDDSEVNELYDEGEIEIPVWLAKEKGLI